MDIRQKSGAAEADAFIAWSEVVGLPLAPLARIPVRDTYDGLLRYGGVASPFRGAEFSVRCGERACVSRVAFAPRGVTTDAGEWIAPVNDAQRRVVRAALAIDSIDLLLGRGENGAKLYIQRPQNMSPDAFRRAATEWLSLTGEPVGDDHDLDFACVDFAPDGAMTPKIYRVAADRARVRQWFGAPALAETLESLPAAQYVVTVRGSGLTLHARLFDDALPRLDHELAELFAQLRARTTRRLVPTHLSWSEPRLSQTLYYMVDAHA